jgi:thiamine-monophosphate kinase
MIDVSDGLLADLAHVARASGVTIDVARPEPPQRLVEVGSALGVDPVHWVLTGGEDHALVATFPAEVVLPPGWTPIGTVREGKPEVLVQGRPYRDAPAGWDHFTR